MSWKLKCFTFILLFFHASIVGNTYGDGSSGGGGGGGGGGGVDSSGGGASGGVGPDVSNPCVTLACPGTGQAYLPDPKNCSQYYQCTGKAPAQAKICQPTLPFFDQNQNICSDDPLVCCQNSSMSLLTDTSPSLSVAYAYSSSPRDGLTSTTTTTTTTTTVAKTTPSVSSSPDATISTSTANTAMSTTSVAPTISTAESTTVAAADSTATATTTPPATMATTVEPSSSTTVLPSTATAMATPNSGTTTTVVVQPPVGTTTATGSTTTSGSLLLSAPSDGSTTTDARTSSLTEVLNTPVFFERQLLVAPSSGTSIDGTSLTFTCSYIWVSGLFVAHVDYFRWFLNGNLIDSTGRISINQPSKPSDDYYWISTISFQPALYTDSGNLSCYVFISGNIANVTSVLNQVLAKPVVSIFPFVQTIYEGNQTTLSCTASQSTTKFSSPVSDNLTIVWLRDSVLQDPNAAGNSITSSYSSNRLASVFSFTPANSSDYFCLATNSAGSVSSTFAVIRVLNDANINVCESDDFDGVVWSFTQPGNDDVEMCPNRDTGVATRHCSLDAAWKNPDFDNCVGQKYTDFQNEVFQVRDRNSFLDNSTMVQLAESAARVTENSSNMTSSELELAVYSVYAMADMRKNGNVDLPMQKQELTDVLQSVSNLLDAYSWNKVSSNLAVQLLTSMNWYSQVYTEQQKLNQNEPVMMVNAHTVIQSDGIKLDSDMSAMNYRFPNWTMVDPTETMDESISLSGRTIMQIGNYLSSDPGNMIFYSSSCMNKLGEFLPLTDSQIQSNMAINSPIISLTFAGLDSEETLSPPIVISAQHLQVNSNSSLTGRCFFWNFTSPENGSWMGDGCQTISSNATHTVCNCSHLTNFAILMSPSPAVGVDALVLSIISEIGCIVSIISLALTILLYIFRWKSMKSKRAVILINLCIALIIANIVFLTGSDKTQNQIGCKVVAALLHYFFLVSFFMMLLEGIMLVVYIVCIFHVVRKSHTVVLIVAAWVIPAIIVGVSLAITKTNGYGTDTTCWLSIQDGVIWAFVGPALCIVFVNLIIIVIVLARIANAKVRSNIKRKRNKILSLLRNIIIISPILGVTWIFGVLSVNQSLVVFQYIFAIANSLQGLFIFLLHGLCHSKKSAKSKKQLAQNWVNSPSRCSRSSRGPLEQLGIAMPSETDSSQEDLVKISTAEKQMRAEEEIQRNLSVHKMAFAPQLSNTSHTSNGTNLTYLSNCSTPNGANGQPCGSFFPRA